MPRKSKLEKYVAILELLAGARTFETQGLKELTQLARKTGISKKILKPLLDFLMQHDLVEEQRPSGNKVFYTITKRGLKVLYVVVPIIEQARKIPTTIELHE